MAKMNRKVKISLWVAGAVIVVGAFSYLAIFALSTRAVSTFRGEAADQLNTAVSGEPAGATVELDNVWLGKVLNHDYQKVSDLQPDYEKLLTNVKDFVVVRGAHDALVENYNNGIKGKAPLTSDLLKSVNKYLAAMESHFAGETDRVAALQNLSAKISENTDFDAVSSDINQLLVDNNNWLNELREQLNQKISSFQDKVN